MDEAANFWNHKHPLSAKYEELYEQQVPDSGGASTVVGELLRAASRIGYDWYNNGWGCNNWSGAVNYIRKHMNELPLEADVIRKLNHELDYVYEYSHGEPAPHDEDRAEFAITTITEIVVQGILDTNPAKWTTKSADDDMFELQEESYFEKRNYFSDDEEEY